MRKDIRPIINSWPYRPGKISVRKIIGEDQRIKIQMRLDLGLLHMEAAGRPDGSRPNNCENYLKYYQSQLAAYEKVNHTDIGFELKPEDCKKLRDETLMYYHRYLACFILEDYDRVIDDTFVSMQIFDLCTKYAAKRNDRFALEQYRPYVIMMNTRAKAQQAAKCKKIPLAIQHIRTGLKTIRNLFDDADQPEEYGYSAEVAILKQLGRKMQRKLPGDPQRIIEKKLQKAIEGEKFEEAAILRDQLKKLKKHKNKKHHQAKGETPPDLPDSPETPESNAPEGF
jgi:hypothetical protein